VNVPEKPAMARAHSDKSVKNHGLEMYLFGIRLASLMRV
jgi:hypothetical protein